MGSEALPLHNSGIYKNLPTFSPDLKDLTAIVTGANGISGFHTLRALLDSPQRWSKVYTLSRRAPPQAMLDLLTPEQRSRVQFVSADFLNDPKDIAKAMTDAGVKADYVFFYSYLQPKPPPGTGPWSNAEELVKVNEAIFGNFLKALEAAEVRPKRVLLQTGAKNYGIHIGRTRTPSNESDPLPKHLGPNFYYPQYDLLESYHKRTGIPYNIICPAWIIGSTTSAQINALHPFAVYAAVQAHKGERLQFPGNFDTWQFQSFHATARLTGYLSEWAVLEEKCANEKFNAQDTSPLSWDRFYEELARWYGVPGVEPPSADPSKYMELTGASGKDTPLGYGPPTKHYASFSFVQWAQQAENHDAWKAIMESSHGKVTDDPFNDPVESFQMADATMGIMGIMNMNKARRLGWTGYVDTIESIFEMYQENAKLGLLPGMKVKGAKPNV